MCRNLNNISGYGQNLHRNNLFSCYKQFYSLSGEGGLEWLEYVSSNKLYFEQRMGFSESIPLQRFSKLQMPTKIWFITIHVLRLTLNQHFGFCHSTSTKLNELQWSLMNFKSELLKCKLCCHTFKTIVKQDCIPVGYALPACWPYPLVSEGGGPGLAWLDADPPDADPLDADPPGCRHLSLDADPPAADPPSL